ncbi:hypothetical protein GMOD_00002551 [Pyrenophora seminiperda CCB06]|uniref:Uncharacterized protein n=1 Tax=Pyrenophora seminiperda CCB06 TaxID=1302712 RepID=A0A3M7M2M5_9PLEO|nr:hypothetical protein GMOD_00002551 [Pyrenophora seminiperda CCB06]
MPFRYLAFSSTQSPFQTYITALPQTPEQPPILQNSPFIHRLWSREKMVVESPPGTQVSLFIHTAVNTSSIPMGIGIVRTSAFTSPATTTSIPGYTSTAKTRSFVSTLSQETPYWADLKAIQHAMMAARQAVKDVRNASMAMATVSRVTISSTQPEVVRAVNYQIKHGRQSYLDWQPASDWNDLMLLIYLAVETLSEQGVREVKLVDANATAYKEGEGEGEGEGIESAEMARQAREMAALPASRPVACQCADYFEFTPCPYCAMKKRRDQRMQDQRMQNLRAAKEKLQQLRQQRWKRQLVYTNGSSDPVQAVKADEVLDALRRRRTFAAIKERQKRKDELKKARNKDVGVGGLVAQMGACKITKSEGKVMKSTKVTKSEGKCGKCSKVNRQVRSTSSWQYSIRTGATFQTPSYTFLVNIFDNALLGLQDSDINAKKASSVALLKCRPIFLVNLTLALRLFDTRVLCRFIKLGSLYEDFAIVVLSGFSLLTVTHYCHSTPYPYLI